MHPLGHLTQPCDTCQRSTNPPRAASHSPALEGTALCPSSFGPGLQWPRERQKKLKGASPSPHHYYLSPRLPTCKLDIVQPCHEKQGQDAVPRETSIITHISKGSLSNWQLFPQQHPKTYRLIYTSSIFCPRQLGWHLGGSDWGAVPVSSNKIAPKSCKAPVSE